MVSKKVLEMMKAFVNQYDGVEVKGDDEATFELENYVAWFDNYQYNIDNHNDGYVDKYVVHIVNYWKKYLKNKKLKKYPLEKLLLKNKEDK